MTPPPRPPHQRKEDAVRRLEHDVDAWVATADAAGGIPYLVPLSFLWDGSTLLVATPAASPTGRNLQATGAAKTGFDPRALSTPYLYVRIRPQRLQAWREADELDGRELMRDGRWLVP